MNYWLQNFPYRIDIPWWLFAVASTTVLSIALLTSFTRSYLAATVKPVESIKEQ